MRKWAFTLSEILLVLTVIGVIASLTIPTIIQKVDSSQNVVALKNAYSFLSSAVNMISAENGGIQNLSVWYPDGQDANIVNAFAGKLNFVKNCGTGTGCFPNVMYKYLDGNNWMNVDTTTSNAKAILSNGNLVYFNDKTGSCSADAGDGPLDMSECSSIFIDVNGFKGPNQVGRDAFYFHITTNGLYPTGIFNDTANCTTNGTGCTGRVLSEGAINY